MSRFYVPKEKIDEARNIAVIDGEEAHHVVDVMRLKEPDKVVMFDGTGNEYTGFIKSVDKRSKNVTVEIVKAERPAPARVSEVTLVQAIPKKGKMDTIVDKATELGAGKIKPVITARTVVRPDEAGINKKAARWRKIAVVSAKQCGRADVPEVDEPASYGEVLGGIDEYDLVLVACLSGKTVPLKEAVGDFTSGRVMILVGPEGDFTPEEISLASGSNVKHVSLGWRVLKSDTAGLFMLSVLGYELGI